MTGWIRREPATPGRLLFLSLLTVASLLASCSSDEGTPEDQVRSLLETAERAAEAKDLPALGGMVAEGYSDSRGNDRQAITAVVRYHFLRNEAIHLLTRVGGIEFTAPGKAEVALLVAMAGEPIPGVAEIEPLRADLFRFSLTLSAGDDGKWRLVTATWGRAGAADFL